MIQFDFGYKLIMGTKLKSFILSAGLIALVSTGFGHLITTQISTKDSLGGKWYLQSSGTDTSFRHIPELQFDIQKRHFTGSTGCNRISGNFHFSGDSLYFNENMITTRMFCEGVDEQGFLKKLISITNYTFKKGRLILLSKGSKVFIWSRKPATLKTP